MPRPTLRRWQELAIKSWEAAGRRGIVSVVTGGGKTVFALACIDAVRPETSLVVVPTVALLEQWWEEVAAYFGLELDEINILESKSIIKRGTVNIAVLNTAAKLEPKTCPSVFLIVDECHKAASSKFRRVLDLPKSQSLGLSATPQRQYDDGLREVLIPGLGEVIYEYTYAEALADSVIVPFVLKNIVFELEPENQAEYDKLTRKIAEAIKKHGFEAEATVSLMLRRARVLNLSTNRVRLALRLVAGNRGKRILIFHEDIEACNLIFHVLNESGVPAGVYHSELPARDRADMLGRYRRGDLEVLVTCRALDEGFNVPETQIGIIAASTATRRQRIQRLGRVLRPAADKSSAVVYSLVATGPEIDRLREEEANLEGVATVEWTQA